MTEEQKDRLRELIAELIVSNRDQVFEEMRWDSTRGYLKACQEQIDEDEAALETFIEGL